VEESKIRGKSILFNPLLNKGSAFTHEEREKLGIKGLLPDHVSSMSEQLERRYASFKLCSTDLSKYIFLTDLQNRNEVLFYKFCSEHVKETLPYIYTPVVGEASLYFSLQYNHVHGLYITYDMKDDIESVLRNIQAQNIKVIVATDGGRVLGLGDVGVGGMTIPIGKTTLYTLFGGVSPESVLPIFLDVGTNNEELLKNPLYIGRRTKRVDSDQYYEFMDKFVAAIKKVFPEALLQWEDLLGIHAQKVLDRYKDKILSFNDDIQGTAGVVLAGLLSALKQKKSKLEKEKIAIFGGGAAGLGIAHIIYRYLVYNGVKEDVAKEQIYIIDRFGLTYTGQEGLLPQHEFFAKKKSLKGDIVSLDETIKEYKITILIGASAQPNAFKESTIKALLNNTKKPIIFPLSNPHTKSEATPEMIVRNTDGNAIIATGTAFPPVSYKGKVYLSGQCNNVYIFPAIGLFSTAFKIDHIPEVFFYIAGETLSKISGKKRLFPEFESLKEASKTIAIEIAKYASAKGLIKKYSAKEIDEKIKKTVWEPVYKEY
jgi:malate dehydrogenase (oxaloacetate-decarboxylating)